MDSSSSTYREPGSYVIHTSKDTEAGTVTVESAGAPGEGLPPDEARVRLARIEAGHLWLKIGGQTDGTWLTPDEARDVAHALLREAAEAPETAPTVRINDPAEMDYDLDLYLRAAITYGSRAVMAMDGDEDAQDEARAVWHAAEVALGILSPRYLPKFEAMLDVAALLERVCGDEYPELMDVLNGLIEEHDEKLRVARVTTGEAE